LEQKIVSLKMLIQNLDLLLISEDFEDLGPAERVRRVL